MDTLDSLRDEITNLDEELIPIVVSLYSDKVEKYAGKNPQYLIELLDKRTRELPLRVAQAKFAKNPYLFFETKSIPLSLRDGKRETEVLTHVAEVTKKYDTSILNFVLTEYREIINLSLENQINYIKSITSEKQAINF